MNVQDQKLESRIAELQGQLDAANQQIAALEDQVKELTVPEGLTWGQLVDAGFVSARMDRLKAAKEAAERKLAAARAALTTIRDMDISGWNPDKTWTRALDMKEYAREALAQIEQPPAIDTVPNTKGRDWVRDYFVNASEHPPAPSDETQELRRTAADWQKQFHQLMSLCKERGLTVGYGDHGQVTLSEEPKQQRPGEDPPFDACRCPACVTIRAKLRSGNEL